jgi:hypothetical protein
METVESRADRMGRRTRQAGKFAAVGLGLLVAAGTKAAQAAAADQKAQAGLANTLEKVTGATDKQKDAVESWIDKTARAKGVADDELRPALDKLVGSTKNVEEAQKLTNLAMDIAARTGKPLASVADKLAKGHDGNTKALGKLVPGLDAAVLASGDFDAISKELAKTTGGAAATAADTAAGKYARMQIAFGELQEQLGAFLLPILFKLAGILAQVAQFVQDNSTAVAIVVGVLATFAIGVLAVNAAYSAYQSITRAATAAQAAFNLVMSLNPIALVILAIVALAAGFVVAYKRSETFRDIVQGVGRAAAAAVGWVVDKAKAVWDWFGRLGPAASAGKELVVKAFDAYTKPIQFVIGLIKDVVDWISKIDFPSPPGWMKDLGGLVGLGGDPGGTSSTGVRSVAAGGRGGPLGSSMFDVMGGSSAGGNVYIQVNGALDPVSVGQQLYDLLRQHGVRVGRPVVVS